MEDWQKVRMITTDLTTVLRDEIKRANDKDGVIETYEAERFIDSIEWLHEVTAERAQRMRGVSAEGRVHR